MDANFLLSAEQIHEYLEYGILVVDNVLDVEEVDLAKNGFQKSLQERGVRSFDPGDIASAQAFNKLSSTNGSGGVLDIFYDDWKMYGIATHPKLFAVTKQLWKAAYSQGGEGKESLQDVPEYLRSQWHPYGKDIDYEKGYVYIDRVGYRVPSHLAQSWGDQIHPDLKKKKLRSIQRSLTPHLDCCPDTMYEGTSKWRPIQCFVSLTDNFEPNTGGFEAVPGFHHVFEDWAKRRAKADSPEPDGKGSTTSLCVGEYTHIRPKEDADVMKQVRHIPVQAGSAVFWDNRIPHANAYRNDSDVARAVVYCSFLPDVPLNQRYVEKQLEAWRLRIPIRDQWNHIEKDQEIISLDGVSPNDEKKFTNLGGKLMGIDPW